MLEKILKWSASYDLVTIERIILKKSVYNIYQSHVFPRPDVMIIINIELLFYVIHILL